MNIIIPTIYCIILSSTHVVRSRYSDWLEDRGVGVRVPVRSRILSSPRRPDRLRVHLTSYPMGTGRSFPGGKAAEA
jgi:hypothetical protein